MKNLIEVIEKLGVQDKYEELPWQKIEIPPYPNQFKNKKWQLDKRNIPILRGYFNGIQSMEHDNICLSRNNELWMSLGTMEIESLSPHIGFANGVCLVVGAGLGLAAYNIAKKNNVRYVLVAEKDKEVCEINKDLCKLWYNKGLVPHGKISIIHSDIFDMESLPVHINYMYVDIWRRLGSSKVIDEVRKIQAKTKAIGLSWWGYEIDFINWITKNKDITTCHLNGLNPTKEDINMWKSHLNMPVNIYSDLSYWSVKAMKNIYYY